MAKNLIYNLSAEEIKVNREKRFAEMQRQERLLQRIGCCFCVMAGIIGGLILWLMCR